MRLAVAIGIALCCTTVQGQDVKPLTRHGVVAIFNKYPQSTPKETLESVLKALEAQHVDYVLAHLTDPVFVDRRVKEYGGKFEELVEESRVKLANNPSVLPQLRRFLKAGEWDKGEETISVKLKEVRDQQVVLKKIGNRWFLVNLMKPAAEGK